MYKIELTLYQKVMDIVIPPFGKDSIKCHLQMYMHVHSTVTVTKWTPNALKMFYIHIVTW